MARCSVWWKTPEEHLRANARVDPKTKCHLWTGAISGSGHRQIKVGPWVRAAHRVAYELAFGPVPKGMVIRHRCQHPLCVNPSHLDAERPDRDARGATEAGPALPIMGGTSGAPRWAPSIIRSNLRRLTPPCPP